MSAKLKLVDGEPDLVDAALAIAQERENNTRALCRAVFNSDFDKALELAKELLPNEASHRTNQSKHRSASR